ncbi:MAG: hypothetical protein B7Z58_01865 [Acidiphilium sp. 37-64-53]|nr:MAG: hypothetical protein B7Z58_01865 [Acidiphilium sp. 37-64-53]OZB27019.1 MAG: hypothetical protein B7X49_11720 [Acidiphilium sp. 34-64-41]
MPVRAATTPNFCSWARASPIPTSPLHRSDRNFANSSTDLYEIFINSGHSVQMRPTLKSTIGAMLDSFGTHRATTPPSGEIAMAAHLAALFKSLKIDLVIDVGADQGQFGTLLRDHVGYTGPIASFEPIPASFATLQHRASIDPMWQVEHAALGEALGDLPLNVIDLQNFRPVPPPNTQRLPARHTAQIKRQTIPVRTLDDIVPALRTRTRARHIFLKLDDQRARSRHITRWRARARYHRRHPDRTLHRSPVRRSAPLSRAALLFSGEAFHPEPVLSHRSRNQHPTQPLHLLHGQHQPPVNPAANLAIVGAATGACIEKLSSYGCISPHTWGQGGQHRR